MVKLTAELIDNSRQIINAVQDRELDLRGYKIPAVENMGATYNQFDTVDFSDNDLKRFENFPLLPRLKCVFFNNNRISLIQPDIGQYLPSLNTLVLTNNNMQELGDVNPLATLKKLEYLSLLGNPVTHKPQYRIYVIYKIPQLRVLDYKRIRLVERESAAEIFGGKKGSALMNEVVKKSKTFQPGQMPVEPNRRMVNGKPVLPSEDIIRIKNAITAAKSLSEVERLQQMLQSGEIPGKEMHKNQQQNANQNSNGMEEEVEDEMEAD